MRRRAGRRWCSPGTGSDFGLDVPALSTSPSATPYCLVIQGTVTSTSGFMWDCHPEYADQRWYLGGAIDGNSRTVPMAT